MAATISTRFLKKDGKSWPDVKKDIEGCFPQAEDGSFFSGWRTQLLKNGNLEVCNIIETDNEVSFTVIIPSQDLHRGFYALYKYYLALNNLRVDIN